MRMWEHSNVSRDASAEVHPVTMSKGATANEEQDCTSCLIFVEIEEEATAAPTTPVLYLRTEQHDNFR